MIYQNIDNKIYFKTTTQRKSKDSPSELDRLDEFLLKEQGGTRDTERFSMMGHQIISYLRPTEI